MWCYFFDCCQRFCYFIISLFYTFVNVMDKRPKSESSSCYCFRTRKICAGKPKLKKKSVGPKGRSGHRITVDDKYLYSFGGYNPLLSRSGYPDENTLFRELWSMHLLTGEWKLLEITGESFPNELVSTATGKIGNHMLIHGGTGVPFGESSSNSTISVNLQNGNAFVPLNTRGTPPTPKYGQAIAIDTINRRLYIVGGTSGHQFFMDVHCLDFKSLEWSEIQVDTNETPKGRYRHEVALFEDQIFVFGGGTVHETFNFEVLPVLNLKTGKWTSCQTEGFNDNGKKQYPSPRRCHGCVMIPASGVRQATVVICGGCDGIKSFADIWSLNLTTKEWCQWKEPLPRPMFFHDAAVTPQGKVYIFGGIIAHGGTERRTNKVVSFWGTIPNLSEIAWEAIQEYYPSLMNEDSHHLKKLGIPPTFVDRVSRE